MAPLPARAVAATGRAMAAPLLFAAALGLPADRAAGAAEPAERTPVASRFVDADDSWFDVSGFLDTAYGFVPLVAPITEPAVGYGAAGALLFIDRAPGGKGRPNIAAAGGLRTENGTRGLFAAHVGTWGADRVRTLVGVVDADVNLDFFGLGGDRAPGGAGLAYTIAMRGGVAGASYRVGETPIWLGLQYGLADTSVSWRGRDGGFGAGLGAGRGMRLAALVPSVTVDARDNFFTPTDGWYLDLSLPVFNEAIGSDRDFRRPALAAMLYQPLLSTLYLSARVGARSSTEGTPFYLRPSVSLRGVQAMKYQGDQAAEAEVELRWQFHPRFSVVGFAGTGVARTDTVLPGRREQTVSAGGAGFRYLLARTYGLHMGIDVAYGPDKPIIYVVFGNAWVRP